jgi:hypothetical protein
MNIPIQYEIMLPSAKDIMIAQQGEQVADYRITASWLEYETIRGSELCSRAVNTYVPATNIKFIDVSHKET